ncbi:MAG: nitrate reductase cytochrome c-type subunit [Campylobacter sp.]|nr:nitrate reductase cytochrome c-type subunit [Campylobacter sp.]
MKKKMFLLSAAASLFIAVCTLEAANSDQMKIVRGADLENENKVILGNIDYNGTQPGESTLVERSYENAPPIIPHSIEGMLPITTDNNSCLSCHDKSIAKDVGATPIPATHYYDYRHNKKTGNSISDARFNCNQCHVALSDAKPLVENNFKADFKNEKSKKSSNLFDVINEGVK